MDTLKKYKNIILDAFDIANDVVNKSTYPTIIMDKDFTVIYVNEFALRLHSIPLDDIYMKNYFGIFCRSEAEYEEFTENYSNIAIQKKPTFIDNDRNNSSIMIFPMLSLKTGEVEAFYNIYIVEESHMSIRQKDDLRFNHDYVYFANQLSLLLETKDSYTANHSSNVTKYSALLGKSLGLNSIELDKLKLAANLHDIGKVSIPNHILNKKGTLNKDESKSIKEHAYYSGNILKVFENLGDISEAGLYHHERYDGGGYPYGISGKNIPLNARIIAIADAFDAMTTDRPYRKAMKVDYAIQELKNNKRTQFDPYLVDKFVNLNLKEAMKPLNDFDRNYRNNYTIPVEQLQNMTDNLNTMFENIDRFVVIENLVEYKFYGFILAKDFSKNNPNLSNRFEIIYKNQLVDDLIYKGYLYGNWHMCLKEKKLKVCNQCPLDIFLKTNSTYEKKAKLINHKGENMYLNTLVHPSYSAKDDTTYILEIFKNETLSAKYGNVIATEFFNFVDNLSKIFAEQNDEFSIIYRELRGLANWIAIKTNISEHKTELLNKALSICDLGIIGLLDSNEHAFESLKKLRTNTKHIEIIYGMITNLSSFSDIKDIVLYHHIDYNDTGYKLSGDDVPIQSYIISTADFLLTHIVMGESVDDALEYLESYCGTRISPTICKSILHGNTREELIEILSMVLTTQ